jgi:hypothetical protein
MQEGRASTRYERSENDVNTLPRYLGQSRDALRESWQKYGHAQTQTARYTHRVSTSRR